MGARSNALVCGCSPAEIVSSNTARSWISVSVSVVCCHVGLCEELITGPDKCMVRHCVWSINLMNEEDIARVGSQRQRRQKMYNESSCPYVKASWNVMVHAQKPHFVFRRNGWVHLNWLGLQFCWLLAAEVCSSAVIMLDTPCSEVVWRVLATDSIRQFPLHFPSRMSPRAITFQLYCTYTHPHLKPLLTLFSWSGYGPDFNHLEAFILNGLNSIRWIGPSSVHPLRYQNLCFLNWFKFHIQTAPIIHSSSLL